MSSLSRGRSSLLMIRPEYRGKERLTSVSVRQVRSLFPANRGRWIGEMPIMPLTHCEKPHALGGLCGRTLDHPGRCKRQPGDPK